MKQKSGGQAHLMYAASGMAVLRTFWKREKCKAARKIRTAELLKCFDIIPRNRWFLRGSSLSSR